MNTENQNPDERLIVTDGSNVVGTTAKPRSLTKENFWNELTEYSPSVMDDFCKWIDEYKKRVDWGQLFYTPHSPQNRDIKFHDIPIEMQVGIFFQFTLEYWTGESNHLLHDNVINSMHDFAQAIREWFIELKRFQRDEQAASENFDEQI